MSIPSPAAPATTVKVPNTTGQYACVTTSGATGITHVFVYDQSGNTVDYGTANGTFSVPPGGSISMTYSGGTLAWTWAAAYQPYQSPAVYASENLITNQASPNDILHQLPVGSTSRSLAGGTGFWSGTSSSAGLAMGVSN
jgi:hypothetical protein